MTAPETFTEPSKRPLTTGRRPDMAYKSFFIVESSVLSPVSLTCAVSSRMPPTSSSSRGGRFIKPLVASSAKGDLECLAASPYHSCDRQLSERLYVTCSRGSRHRHVGSGSADLCPDAVAHWR